VRIADPGGRRSGVVLLEVLVALAIVAVSATAMVALASESLRAAGRAQAADDATAQADDFLQIVALWPRADLDRHLGDRRQGPWNMRVDRPTPTLYTVTLHDSTGRAVLHTSLFRAEDADHDAR
jgi:type II secretory pathway pseudopilin PulG